MKLKKRWILGGIATLLLGVLLLLALLGWGVSTEGGSQWIIRQASQFVPGKLEIAQIEGKLISRIKVVDVKYQQDDLNVTVAEAELQWMAAALLSSLLHVEKLTVTGVAVQLPPAQPSPEAPETSEPFAMPDIQLPIGLQLDDVHITQVTIQPDEGQAIEVEEIIIKGEVQEKATLKQLELNAQIPAAGIHLQANAQGELGLQMPHPVQLQLDWGVELPEQPTLMANAQVNGDLSELVIQHDLQPPYNLQLAGTVKNAVTDPEWQMQLDWEQLAYPLATETPSVALPQGQLTSTGALDSYQIQLNTQLAGEQIPSGEWQLQATGDTQKIHIEALQGTALQGQIYASGEVNWTEALTAAVQINTEQLVLTPFWADWPAELGLDSQLQATWQNQVVNIKQFTATLPTTQTTIELAGNVDLTEPAAPRFNNTVLYWDTLQYPLDAKPMVQAPQGEATLQGTLQDYQLNLTTALHGEHIPMGEWQAAIKGSLEAATVEQLQGDTLGGQITATGQVAWVDTVQASLELAAEQLVLTELWADWESHLKLDGSVQVQLDESQLAIQQATFTIPKTNTQLTAMGTADLLATPEFDIVTRWQNLQYPLAESTPLAQSRTGQLAVVGTPDKYTLQLNTQLQGKEIPKGNWKATGQGNTQQFKLAGLHGDILAGKVDLTGQVAWQPAVNWQLQLTGNRLNPAQQWQALPGRLALDIRSQGTLKANQPLQAELEVKHIKGTLNNYPLNFTAKAGVASDTYQLSTLKLRSGNNQLTATGSLGKTLTADWQLKASELSVLIPDAQGTLEGQGTLSGTPTAPNINARLNGRDVGLADMVLQRLSADVQADLQKGGKIAIDVAANSLQQQGKTVVEKLTLTGTGQVEQHRLNATLKTPEDSLALQLQGAFDATTTQWQGLLQELQAKTALLGTWTLAQPSQLTASPQQVKLTESCLTQQQASICNTLDWSTRSGSAIQASVDRLPLSLANPMVTGELNGLINGQLLNNGRLRAEADLAVSPGVIKTGEYINAETISHNGGTLQLTLNQQGLKSDLNLRLLDQSGLTGVFEMPGFNGLALSDNQPVKGEFKVFFPDLSIVPSFVPDLANTEGSANADLTLNGTVGKPAIQGVIAITNARTEYPELGLNLSEINLKLTGDGQDKIRLQGRLKSGEGYLDLMGVTQFATLTEWQADIQVLGDNVEVINTPDVWAKVSPDISVAATPQTLDITGTLTVPAARISPNLVSVAGGEGSAVAVSQDVIIIDEETVEAVATPAGDTMQIRSRVRVILGDAIEVDAIGFKSRLAGSLWVEMEPPELLPVLSGQVNIVDGTYRAYGQDLEIQQGNISYDGGAIDNPAIYIKAVRKVHNDPKVKSAGVVVSGTAQALQLDLISEPRVPDGEILSYIITGRNALAQSEDGETQGGINRLSLGTYVQPNLYVGYGISLFDRSSVFTLRYEINKTWGIDAQIGQEDKGVGVSYTLEY